MRYQAITAGWRSCSGTLVAPAPPQLQRRNNNGITTQLYFVLHSRSEPVSGISGRQGFDFGHSLPPNPGSRFLGGAGAVVHEGMRAGVPPPVCAAREYGGGRLWQGRVGPI